MQPEQLQVSNNKHINRHTDFTHTHKLKTDEDARQVPTAENWENEQPTARYDAHGACGVPFLPISDLWMCGITPENKTNNMHFVWKIEFRFYSTQTKSFQRWS